MTLVCPQKGLFLWTEIRWSVLANDGEGVGE